MKAEDLRALDAEELQSRLKGVRRELYELRFKLAVGQLDNHREIRKARKDIARILTIMHLRRLTGEEATPSGEMAALVDGGELEAASRSVELQEAPGAAAGAEPKEQETPEHVEASTEQPAEPASGRRRRRRTDREDGDD